MRPMIRRCLTFGVLLISLVTARADGPADNLPDKVRPVPPRGIAIADADRTALRAGVDELGRQIDALRESLRRKPDLLRLLPDVQVYHKAVRDALAYDEFYKPGRDRRGEGPDQAGPRAGRPVARGPRPVEHGHRAGGARLRLEDRRLGPAVRPGRAGVVPAGHAASIPARRLVPRPRREPERAELHRRPAEVAAASSRRRTRSSCIPTAATATPTSSPARSTSSRRSRTSRSTTRSTRTAW